MTPQTKARIDFLVDHEYSVYRYDVRNVDLAKLFHTQDPEQYEDVDPSETYLVLEDHHGNILATGEADDITNAVDTKMTISHNRRHQTH